MRTLAPFRTLAAIASATGSSHNEALSGGGGPHHHSTSATSKMGDHDNGFSNNASWGRTSPHHLLSPDDSGKQIADGSNGGKRGQVENHRKPRDKKLVSSTNHNDDKKPSFFGKLLENDIAALAIKTTIVATIVLGASSFFWRTCVDATFMKTVGAAEMAASNVVMMKGAAADTTAMDVMSRFDAPLMKVVAASEKAASNTVTQAVTEVDGMMPKWCAILGACVTWPALVKLIRGLVTRGR